jgi:hypothetical protein
MALTSIRSSLDWRPSYVPRTLRDVPMPVLAQAGDDWHRRRARIAHEYLMSSTMRNILGSFLRPYAALIGQRGLVLRDYIAYQQELVRIGERVT